MAKTEKELSKVLISYSGSVSATVDFGILRLQCHKQWERAVKKAVKRKKEKPLKPVGVRDSALFLKVGSTAEVTEEELGYLKSERPDVFRFIQVHRGVSKVPRSMRSKPVEEKSIRGSGEGEGGKKTRKVKTK